MADLITLEEYKEAQGITKNDQDAQLNLIISAVSSLIQTYIGFPINEVGEVTETITPSFSTNVIHIQGYPINSIVSVNELDPYIVGTGLDSTVKWPLLIDSDFRYNSQTGGLIRTSGYWGTVEVTYNTGYVQTPADLKLAAFALVEYYHKKNYVQSKSIMGTNQVNVVSEDIPPHVKMILDGYKIT